MSVQRVEPKTYCKSENNHAPALLTTGFPENWAPKFGAPVNPLKDGPDSTNKPKMTIYLFPPSTTPALLTPKEELVRSLEKLHAHQNRLWRTVFAVLISCYIVFLLFSIYQQTAHPWELRYHAYFMEDMDSRLLILSDWLAVVACTTAILGLIQSSARHRQWIWYSFTGGVLLAIFWLYYMLRLPKFRWDVIWLPFGPISGAALCLYVDHLLNESSSEVRKLRSYMYAYKAM